MKTEAAILVELGQPLALGEIEIPKLKPGQCLVEIAYSGACRTQVLEARGHRGDDPWLPHCLGHEGTGTMIEAGPEVTRAKSGDKVVLSWIAGGGIDAGGTVYDWNGRQVNAGGVTTFARHAVVSENRLTPIPDSLDMTTAVLMGCALPTGFGAVLNTGRAEAGQSVAVFGVGGVGLSAVLGAATAGCEPVIAVDVLAMKLDLAASLGATHVVNASDTDPLAAVAEIASGGVDLAIEATGRPEVMAQALEVVRDRGGRAVVIGNAPFGETMSVNPRLFNRGRSLLGTWGGDSDPDRDFQRFAGLLAMGRRDPSAMLSRPYALADINRVLDDLEAGAIARPLIDMAGD